MSHRSNEAPVNSLFEALRSRSALRFGGLFVLAAALPFTLVACAGDDAGEGTGGASGAGGSTGGAGGATGGSGGATGGSGGATGGSSGATGGSAGTSGGSGGAASGAGGSGGALPPLFQGFTVELVEEVAGVSAFTR